MAKTTFKTEAEFMAFFEGIDAYILARLLRKYVKGTDYVGMSKSNLAGIYIKAMNGDRVGLSTETGPEWKKIDLDEWKKFALEQMAKKPPKETRNPCPGCGLHIRRLTTEVCDVCKAKLKRHDEMVDELTTPRKWVRMPTNDHHLPWFSHSYSQLTDRGVENNAQQAFYELLLSSSEKTVIKESLRIYDASDMPDDLNDDKIESLIEGQEGSWSSCIYVKLNKKQVDAARTLYVALSNVVHSAYESGVRSGSNMLNKMINGELSDKEFTEAVLREGTYHSKMNDEFIEKYSRKKK